METVLAEKLETIITRTVTNTRMRDFYDIYILQQLHGKTLDRSVLHEALRSTAHKRGTSDEELLKNKKVGCHVVGMVHVKNDDPMQEKQDFRQGSTTPSENLFHTLDTF